VFDHSAAKKMAPKRFNKFAWVPSEGASGGIFMGWNSAIFTGQVVFTSRFALTVKFIAVHNAEEWQLTTVYGPCQGQQRQEFIDWFNSLQVDDEVNWMFIGDFNFYRSLENKNKEGGNMQDIMTFNEVISNLGLQEIPLKGRSYTWSNMQQDPLLEQLDWCFTSTNWISDYPSSLMIPLAKTTSDHVPCVVQIGTSIPKA
jgi:endonuclease/exonuclease/phosphatase family metal-dependent hydrolase